MYPSEAPRTQRSLEYYAILKTNEYRSLIFYALAFALKEVMSPKCFNQNMKYIIFLRILNQVVITPSDLKFARILCDEFLIEFMEIYSKKSSETLNFHCHQHLVDQVVNTGSGLSETRRPDPPCQILASTCSRKKIFYAYSLFVPCYKTCWKNTKKIHKS
jgi:hypothetical protein